MCDVQKTRDRLNAALMTLDKTWAENGMFEAVSAVCESLADAKRVLSKVQRADQLPSTSALRTWLEGINVLVIWAKEALVQMEMATSPDLKSSVKRRSYLSPRRSAPFQQPLARENAGLSSPRPSRRRPSRLSGKRNSGGF